jgi:CheY-like chemotaxis protein
VVLTDIKMPVMDGIEVLKRIKEIDPTPRSSSSPATATWIWPSAR